MMIIDTEQEISIKQEMRKTVITENPKPIAIQNGAIIFAVTSSYKILKMKISAIIKCSDDKKYHNVHVEPLDDNDKIEVSQCFCDIRMKNGVFDQQPIFILEQNAKSYAIERINNNEESLLQKLDVLREAKAKLQYRKLSKE
jgi:hypothetical protein